MAWLRLEARCAQWGWTGDLPPTQFAAWIKLLCTIKSLGLRDGRIKASYFCRRTLSALRITQATWDAMLEAAFGAKALKKEGIFLRVTEWTEFQIDPTAKRRQKRRRKAQKEGCHGMSPRVTVERDRTGQDVTGQYTTGQDKEKDVSPDPKAVRAVSYDRASGQWQNITDDDKAEWRKAYPATDPEIELLRMVQWLKANPTKAVKRNWRRFIVNWLAKTQDQGGTKGATPRPETGGETGRKSRYREPEKFQA